MKKNNSLTAVVMVNMIILAFITLNKKYKPLLDKLSKQYITLKKENKAGKSTIDYKKETSKILEEAKNKIGDLGNLVQEALTTYTIQGAQKYEMISTDIPYTYSLLSEQINLKEFPTELIPFNNSIDLFQIDDILGTSALSKTLKKPNIFRQLCGTIALILALNSWKITNIKDASNYLSSYIMEDLEDLLSNTQDDNIVTSPNVVEINTPHSLEQQMEIILTSNMHYEEKWNELLTIDGITLDQSMLEIINSNASKEVILQFIVKTDKLTVKQKVWYALLLSNIPFQEKFNELLTIEDATQNQIIEIIIDMDMVPFETLFNTMLKQESFTNEQFINYLVSYHADYNTVTINEMMRYILSIEDFTKIEKINCIWSLLKGYSLEERTQIILGFYQITYEDYIKLYRIKQKDLNENQSMILGLFEKINEEQEAYILSHYDFESKEQLDSVVAGCAAEGANNYDDLYWVANTFFNRITNPKYVNLYGTNPYCQFIAPSQFAVYESESYKNYLYPPNSQYAIKFAIAKQAFYDMFYAGYNGIEHSYVEFRSWNTIDFSNVYIVRGGNRYGNLMDEFTRIEYDNLLYHETNNYEDNHTFTKKIHFTNIIVEG